MPYSGTPMDFDQEKGRSTNFFRALLKLLQFIWVEGKCTDFSPHSTLILK
jgi:hypothetical protein